MSHGVAAPTQGAAPQWLPADPAHESRWRFVPSPRAIFSVLALYGAFGNAAEHAFKLAPLAAAAAAALPALLAELLLVRPLWNVVFRVQAAASSPLTQLVSNEARAVLPFRNGRGMVSTVRDGRMVQLSACLRPEQAALTVKVGDRLLIDAVDAAQERVTVSLVRD